jgi:hypothetical protein
MNDTLRTVIRRDIDQARKNLYDAIHGKQVDLGRIVVMLDSVIEDLCPHPEGTLQVASDENGRLYVVCPECATEWYPTGGTP